MKARSYWFADMDAPDLEKLLVAYGLEIPKKLYTDGEIRRMKKWIFQKQTITSISGRFTFYDVAKSGGYCNKNIADIRLESHKNLTIFMYRKGFFVI